MKITKINLTIITISTLFFSHNLCAEQDIVIDSQNPLYQAAQNFDVTAVKKAITENPSLLQKSIGNEKSQTMGYFVLKDSIVLLIGAAQWLEGSYPFPSKDLQEKMTAEQAYSRIMEIIKLIIDNTPKDILTIQTELDSFTSYRGNKAALDLTTYFLVDKKMNLPQKTIDNALRNATSNNNITLIILLLNHGANINTTDDYYDQPIFNAYKQKTIEILVNKGANINVQKKIGGNTPLHYVTIIEKNDLTTSRLNLIKFMIDHKADPTITDKDGFTPLALFIAYANTNTSFAGSLLEITPQEKDEIITLLKKEMSKKMSATDIEKQIKLGTKKHEEIIAEELVATNERNIQNAFTAAGGNLKLLTELITTGKIDINIKDTDTPTAGQSLLHYAVACYSRKDYLERVQFLVQHNIDLYALDKENRTALDLAKEKLKEKDKDSTAGKRLQKAIDYLTQEMAKKPAAPTSVKAK